MNWFQHDAASTQDAKIKKLLIRHGAIGYAIYFHCLELIIADTSETNITFELEHDSEIIADNLKISGTGDKSGRDIVEDVMRTIIELGLFTNDGGHIFCFKLLKRINLSMTSSTKLREAINQAKADHHDDIMTHHDEVMTHHATYLPTYPPTNQPTKPTREEGSSRIEQIKKYWNESGAGPECRLLSVQFRPEDLHDCMRFLNVYSDEEILDAIATYARLSKDQEYDTPRYGGFVGFMRGGVEKFVASSNPQELFKIRKKFESAAEREERERAESVARLEAMP